MLHHTNEPTEMCRVPRKQVNLQRKPFSSLRGWITATAVCIRILCPFFQPSCSKKLIGNKEDYLEVSKRFFYHLLALYQCTMCSISIVMGRESGLPRIWKGTCQLAWKKNYAWWCIDLTQYSAISSKFLAVYFYVIQISLQVSHTLKYLIHVKQPVNPLISWKLTNRKTHL